VANGEGKNPQPYVCSVLTFSVLELRTGEMRNSYKSFVAKPAGKRPLGRPKHRREDNISIGHRKIKWECVYWMQLAGRSSDGLL